MTSIEKIGKQYQQLINDMKNEVALYKKADSDSMKKIILDKLKHFTAKKKELEKMLDSEVKNTYKDAELKIEENISKLNLKELVKKEIRKIIQQNDCCI